MSRDNGPDSSDPQPARSRTAELVGHALAVATGYAISLWSVIGGLMGPAAGVFVGCEILIASAAYLGYGICGYILAKEAHLASAAISWRSSLTWSLIGVVWLSTLVVMNLHEKTDYTFLVIMTILLSMQLLNLIGWLIANREEIRPPTKHS